MYTMLYIHWPFCSKKCPYCDFNSFVESNIDHKEWLNGYLNALDHYKEYLINKQITSIFFGGGTPSLAQPNLIYNILNKIANYISNQTEITLEANPTTVEMNKLQDFKAAGINRVSIGIQSLRDNNLKFLGRNHSVKTAVQAIKMVEKVFDNFSLDFIYGLPYQTIDEWKKELKEILSYNNRHLSLYQLTIESNTKFGALAKAGLLQEINNDIAAEMFEITQEMTANKGLYSYEISNHAHPEYQCQHNLGYWFYKDYIGIGPGAHGKLTINNQVVTTIQEKNPKLWLNNLNNALQIEKRETLTNDSVRREKIMMGLRTMYGIEQDLIMNNHNFQELLKENLIYIKNNNIIITEKGKLITDSIIEMLI